MSLSASEVRLQEQALMDDAYSFLTTLGPMVLPMLFVLWDIFSSLGLGVFLNLWFNLNPPLIFGFSYAWLNGIFWGILEVRYWWKHYDGATKASWITTTYWMGGTKRHFENDFKIDHFEPLGRSLKFTQVDGKTIEGLANPEYGFINKPHLWMKKPGIVCDKAHYPPGKAKDPKETKAICIDTDHFIDVAGDMIYEFHFRSKHFPVAIVCLPDVPERLLSFDGNEGWVADGGFLYRTEHIARMSFVRCDFTKTELIPFVPIGVLTDYAQLAADVADERAIVYVGPQAVEVAAKTRDTFYASDYLRKWKDEETLRTTVENQERNIDKLIKKRGAALAGAHDDFKGGIVDPSKGGPGVRNSRALPWLIGLGIIAILIVILAVFKV